MPTLVTQISTCVIRKGKRVFPVIGKPFAYTDEEATYLRSQSPLGLRKPVNEVVAPDEGELDEGTTLDDDLDDDDDGDGDGEGEDAGKAAAKPQTAAEKKAAKAAAAKTAKPASEDDDI